jgi:lysophospholipase L1-like esterase
MKNKIVIFSLSAVIILTGYLFLAHHLIYAKIGSVSLKNPDISHQYIIGQGGNKLVYTAIGDSLTSGVGVTNYSESYPYRLAQKMAGSSGKIDLRVQAYPGARSGDIVRDLLTLAINNNPDVVTVLAGVNDIHGFVSKIQFAENYQEILTRLKSETKAKIYAVSIPHLGADALLWPPYNFYFRYQTIEFNKIIKKLAQADNVEYVDLYTPSENMFNNPDLYSADFFHPSAAGYGLWAEIIYADFNK